MGDTNHISEQEIAQCAEAINNGTYRELDQAIQDHIANCDSCANEVSMIATILEEEEALISGIENKRHEPETKSLNYKATIALLASAASVILFFGVRFFSNNQITNNNSISENINVDTTQKARETKIQSPVIPLKTQPEEAKKKEPIKLLHTKKKHLLAYTPNEQLEKLVDRFDGATMRGENIEVISPILIESKVGQITLEWTNPDNQLLILEFFNNKGEKLFEKETNKILFQPKQLDKSGLYYWKLINEDFDLIFCGRIKLK